jgi:hypothetical protein
MNPITTVVVAMRALWVDGAAGNDIWAAVLWSLGLIAVSAPLSVARSGARSAPDGRRPPPRPPSWGAFPGRPAIATP